MRVCLPTFIPTRRIGLAIPSILFGLGALALVLAAACGGSAPPPREPLGVQGHLSEADRHEADAHQLDERAAAIERTGPPTAYACGDQALADQPTSGGERLGGRAPCWSGERGAIARSRALAHQLRADARAHRAQARVLATTERETCAGLPPEELEHSPFDHREDLAGVEAELDSDRLRGARIRFSRVPGLTAAWLRRALACHQAMAAATGYDPTHLATCPSTVAGADTTVIDDPGGLIVVVRAADPAAALTIYARAEALLAANAPGAETR
jgi:hypothetical protein